MERNLRLLEPKLRRQDSPLRAPSRSEALYTYICIYVCVSFILSLVRSNLADPRLHRLYPFSLPLHFPLYAFLCIDLRPCVFLDRTADREFAEHCALDTRRLPDNECFSSFFSPRRVKADNNYHGSSVFRLDNDSSLPVPIYPFGNVPLSKRGIDRPRSSTFPILFLGSRNRSRLSPLPDYLIQRDSVGQLCDDH